MFADFQGSWIVVSLPCEQTIKMVRIGAAEPLNPFKKLLAGAKQVEFARTRTTHECAVHDPAHMAVLHNDCVNTMHRQVANLELQFSPGIWLSHSLR